MIFYEAFRATPCYVCTDRNGGEPLTELKLSNSLAILDLKNHNVLSFDQSCCKYPFLSASVTSLNILLPVPFFYHIEALAVCLHFQSFNTHPILVQCQEIKVFSEQPVRAAPTTCSFSFQISILLFLPGCTSG